MSTYDPDQTGNYYILGDSHAEMVHLIESDRSFTRSMGGLLPEQPEEVLLRLDDVLDIGCGPGGWVLGLAQQFPHIQASGLDISAGMIEYATVLARASHLENAHFRVGNALEPLDFPDASFDLVNARQLEGVIPTASWPVLLQEMVRVTRPGGMVRLTGNEWGVTNSLAFETIHAFTLQGNLVFGLNHSPDARTWGLVNMASRYLRDAGCVKIQEHPSFLDFSAGAQQHHDASRMWMISAELLGPFLLSAGITTAAPYEHLKGQLSIELTEESFRGIIYTMTVWGHKPEQQEQ
jgi:SAM-dependent methyltransferase